MGNCQAAEAATVVIQHPGGKVERVYWSVSASDVMASNPGHYVAVVVAAPPHAAAGAKGTGGADGSSAPVRHLKLLRPDDTLHIGHVYRLVSFEEVLKEFAAKKHVKLSRLLLAQQQQEEKKRDRGSGGGRGRAGASTHCESSSAMVEDRQQQPHQQLSRQREEDDVHANTVGGSTIIASNRPGGAATRHGHWKPSLQSIAEAAN